MLKNVVRLSQSHSSDDKLNKKYALDTLAKINQGKRDTSAIA
jgi:hypothetical protein